MNIKKVLDCESSESLDKSLESILEPTFRTLTFKSSNSIASDF